MKDIKKFGTYIATIFVISFLGLMAFSSAIEPIVYYAYEGPVFPLTAGSEAEGLAVERIMELDFSTYENTVPGETMVPFNEARKTDVNDIYVLNNATAEDITVEMVYPFVYSLNQKKEWIPQIRIDGTVVETQIVLGRPVSDMVDVYRGESEEAVARLAGKMNVVLFEQIASDDAYFEEALTGMPDTSDAVVVYKFKNLGYDGTDSKAYDPNMWVSYVQGENAEVLPANWDMSRSEEADGIRKAMIGFDLPRPGQEGYGRDGYLVVLGGDISDLEVKCYTSSTGSVLEDVNIKMERYETTLAEVAREIFEAGYVTEDGAAAELLPKEQLFEVFLKGVCESRDRLLNQVVDGDSIDNAWYYLYEEQRVMYAVFEVTVPAGESVRVHAEYEKQASHGVYEADEHLDRYDILSEEYSAFEITSTAVTATGADKLIPVEGENGVKAYLHP